MSDPYQPNPYAQPNPYPQQDPYAQPNPWVDPTSAPTTPPPPPFVSPDTPSYAAGSSPVPTAPQAPDYGYAQTSAPSYGYAAGYGGYGGYGGTPTYVPVMPAPKTNGLAIGSMVVSIVGATLLFCYGAGGIVGIVGAILGHVARRQIKANKESGDGMALAGVIVGWIVAGLGLIVLGFVVVGIIMFANSASSSSYNY
jgi:hypothetical protein